MFTNRNIYFEIHESLYLIPSYISSVTADPKFCSYHLSPGINSSLISFDSFPDWEEKYFERPVNSIEIQGHKTSFRSHGL